MVPIWCIWLQRWRRATSWSEALTLPAQSGQIWPDRAGQSGSTPRDGDTRRLPEPCRRAAARNRHPPHTRIREKRPCLAAPSAGAPVARNGGPMTVAEPVPATVVVSPRSLVRARRVAAVRGFGSAFRRDALAMIGVAVLVGVRPDGVAGAGDQPASRTQRRRLDPQPGVGTSEPRLPVRHRQPRTIRRGPVRVGCACQPVRRCGGNPADGRDRLDRGHRCRVLRRPCRLPVDAPHRLVPRHPVPAPGDRAGRSARSIVAQRDHRHRHHVVAGDRPDHPRPGAHRQATAVRRPRQGARRRPTTRRPPSRPAGGRPADPRQHDAGGADLDPHRDDAGVPRPR